MKPVTPRTRNAILARLLPVALLLSLLPACQPKKELPAESELALPVETASDVATQTVLQGDVVRYEAQPTGSEVTIAGTSTIHAWTVTNRIVGGFIEADTNFPAAAVQPGSTASAPKVEVFIPVRAFKSYNKKMDEIMLEHLNFPKFQKIEYRLLALTPGAGTAAQGAFAFDATGDLTVSGVTRTNVMRVTIQRVDQTKLKVAGSTPLKMTDFGLKPPAPSLALGLIKTGDDIIITFEWLLAKKVDGHKAP